MMRLRPVVLVPVLAAIGISCGGSDPEGGGSRRIGIGPSEVSETAAQQTISGSVSNTAFEPISGAQVTVAGSSLSTVTDVAGRFELSGNFGTAGIQLNV